MPEHEKTPHTLPSAESETDMLVLANHIVDILDLPMEHQASAYQQLCAKFPEHEEILARMEQAAIEIPRGPERTATIAARMRAEADHPANIHRIGSYKILTRLGAGGMGVVYLAEQREPIRRRVAIKLIKPGMDSEQVLARFDLERQALAVMSHPTIARVLDAGTTERGQPYFVMEYVEGIPIDAYCDQHRLSLDERIGIFQQVCQGVQHAHQKGVLHRDLKPGNILISRKNDEHLVKIIDFGMARATNHQLVDQTIYTEQGQLIGTPEYMSPEQAGGNTRDIDTRTDIYSLGVLLYQMLSGTLPFTSEELRTAGLVGIQRIIQEVEPDRPSTKISTVDGCTSEEAEKRGLSLTTLQKHLRGELDWIVMKAMAKEPERRYESATDLAQDLRRYLEHEPVLAGPPSAAYQLSKIVRKYRVQVVAAALLLVVLIAGIITSWSFYRRSEAERLEAVAERQRAEAEAAESAEVTDFLKTMWAFAKPTGGESHAITAVELLDAASRTLDSTVSMKPSVLRSLRTTLGGIYKELSQHEKAERELRAALLLGRTSAREQGQRLAMLMEHLASSLANQAKWKEAKPLIDESMALLLEQFGEDHEQLSNIYHLLAQYHNYQGQTNETLRYSRRALSIKEREYGVADDRTLRAMLSLGHYLGESGELEEAQELLSVAYERRREQLGPKAPSTISALHLLAHLWHRMQRHTEAAECFEEILAAHEAMYGPDHIQTARSTNNLASQYVLLGDIDVAIPMLQKVLRIFSAELPEGHPQTIVAVQNIAKSLADSGRAEEALEYSERAVLLTAKYIPPQHYLHGFTRSTLGECLLQLERFEEALQALTQAYPIMVATRGSEAAPTVLTMRRLARAYIGLGDMAAASEWQHKAGDEPESE